MEPSQTRVARDRVLADLKTLATDAEALLRATASDAGEKAKEARARLSSALEKAKLTYDDLQAEGIASAREAARKADETIRTHPYQSIGVAFGIGLLLGIVLRRDSR
jgi:ElaB/YqjD/DUF883 family membrane-anchored ribosome-binding protein